MLSSSRLPLTRERSENLLFCLEMLQWRSKNMNIKNRPKPVMKQWTDPNGEYGMCALKLDIHYTSSVVRINPHLKMVPCKCTFYSLNDIYEMLLWPAVLANYWAFFKKKWNCIFVTCFLRFTFVSSGITAEWVMLSWDLTIENSRTTPAVSFRMTCGMHWVSCFPITRM